jgi:hypothetical protein
LEVIYGVELKVVYELVLVSLAIEEAGDHFIVKFFSANKVLEFFSNCIEFFLFGVNAFENDDITVLEHIFHE